MEKATVIAGEGHKWEGRAIKAKFKPRSSQYARFGGRIKAHDITNAIARVIRDNEDLMIRTHVLFEGTGERRERRRRTLELHEDYITPFKDRSGNILPGMM